MNAAYPLVPPERADGDDDIALIQSIANGDRPALRALHDRYAGLVYATVFKVLNDHEDAEDVTQEVFFRVWSRAHLFRAQKGKPATWLTVMARNRAIDRLRSKQRRANYYGAYESEADATGFEIHDNDPTKLAQIKDDAQRVRRAVLELTPEQRQAIELTYFEGWTHKMIAEDLGEPLGTIKARVRRGLARLKRRLQGPTS